MKLVREILGNPARDIVEGRTRLVTVQTIPVCVFECVAAPVEVRVLPELVPPPGRNRTLTGGLALWAAMDLFRQSSPGDFTSVQCADFMTAAGWVVGMPRSAAHMALRKLCSNKEVVELGETGNKILWRFVSPVLQTVATATA